MNAKITIIDKREGALTEFKNIKSGEPFLWNDSLMVRLSWGHIGTDPANCFDLRQCIVQECAEDCIVTPVKIEIQIIGFEKIK